MTAVSFVFRRLGLLAAHPAVQIGVIAITALAQTSALMQNRQEQLPAPAGNEPKTA